MAWASQFKTDLAKATISPAFVVEVATFQGVTVPGGAPSLSSVKITSYEQVLDAREVRLPEERIDLRTWSYSGGEWGFVARWRTTTQRETILDAIDRGTPLQLRMGQASYASGSYEVVALGIVSSISEQGRAITVRCWDLLTALRVRVAQASWPLLFGSLNNSPHSTVATTGYTAGDATLDVADASAFERMTGGNYLLRVTPGSGDPFLLLATGVTANQFTGVTASGQFGTTAANAAIGQAVESVPYITGKPDEIARRVLTSTGAGTNGTDDDLPESWGYGLDDGYMSTSDMGVWEAQLGPSSGAHAWTWIAATRGDGTWSAPAADESGLATLTAWMGVVAMWLCMRQGKATLRGVQNVRGGGSLTHTGVTITDRDLCEVETATLEWRDGDQGFEWLNVRVDPATVAPFASTAKSNNVTWPLENVYVADMTSVLWDNEATQADDYETRIKPWYIRIPERLRVRVAGYEWNQYAVGDLVYIESVLLRGRLDSTATLDGTVPYMIAAKRPGHPAPYVDFDLVTVPEDGADERE